MSEISTKYANNNGTSDTLSREKCPLSRFDCRGGQFNESSLQEHYFSEQHQRSLTKYAQQIIESTNGDSSKADVDMGEENSSLLELYEKLTTTTKKIETNYDELDQLDDKILRLSNQIASLPEQLNDIQLDIASQKVHIDAESLSQSILKQDITTLQQQIENKKEIINQEPDGTMVWKITNVREKMYDAQSERQTSIYCPPFYTSTFGYKLSVRLYLNGDGSARGSHVSVFLVILRGPYDSLLKWPFSYRVSFCLYDQRTIIDKNGTIQPKHVIQSFRPDISSISFQRPRSAMNIAAGIPKFLLLNDLNQPANENLYIVNDTMYIKALIDFTGIPRLMLPFIFNLNIALPVHIQQKLILEEVKRREQ